MDETANEFALLKIKLKEDEDKSSNWFWDSICQNIDIPIFIELNHKQRRKHIQYLEI